MVVLSKISPPKFTFQWGPRSLKWDTFEDEVGCICEVLIAMLEDADEALEQTVDGQQDEIQEHTSALKDRIGGYVQWFRRALQSWSAAYQKQISDDINQMVVLLEQQMLLPEVKKVPPTTCLSLWARIVGLKKGLTFETFLDMPKGTRLLKHLENSHSKQGLPLFLATCFGWDKSSDTMAKALIATNREVFSTRSGRNAIDYVWHELYTWSTHAYNIALEELLGDDGVKELAQARKLTAFPDYRTVSRDVYDNEIQAYRERAAHEQPSGCKHHPHREEHAVVMSVERQFKAGTRCFTCRCLYGHTLHPECVDAEKEHRSRSNPEGVKCAEDALHAQCLKDHADGTKTAAAAHVAADADD